MRLATCTGVNGLLIHPRVSTCGLRCGSQYRASPVEKARGEPHHSDLSCRPVVSSKFPETALSEPIPAAIAPEITLYTSAICGYCVAAKNFLRSRGLQWTEVRIDTEPAQREKMVALARRTSVPQIFIGDVHVGGYDDLIALHRAGKLERLLAGEGA